MDDRTVLATIKLLMSLGNDLSLNPGYVRAFLLDLIPSEKKFINCIVQSIQAGILQQLRESYSSHKQIDIVERNRIIRLLEEDYGLSIESIRYMLGVLDLALSRHYGFIQESNISEPSQNRSHMVEKTCNNGFRSINLATSQNNSVELTVLGLHYLNGQGMSKNCKEAIKCFQIAVDQGNPQAQFLLGLCYANGDGVEKNKCEAARLYQLAAEQGLAEAQHNLGMCYFNGDGLKCDIEESINWFQMAAMQNNGDAQYSLGVCYEKGYGVKVNQLEANKWFALAARHGVSSNSLARV